MRDEEWIKSAMADDSLVVELLIRLCSSEAYTSSPAKKPATLPPLDWAVRQPRSRQILRCDSVQVKKEGESTRASPTTPLSWSGGTGTSVSGSGAVDCFEESSFPTKRSAGSVRSKVNATSETTIRRSKKKKSFAELKEEENLLVKERIHLKKELAKYRSTCEEQKARNEDLKRIKLDLQLQSEKGTIRPSEISREPISDPSHHIESASIDETPAILPENSFVLPDLNLPLEDDSGSEILYGIS